MYVNMFACPVPNERREEYLKHSTAFAAIIMEHGCSRYTECWGDAVPNGTQTSFLKAVQCRDGESVVIGWGEWPDKATCDAGMEKTMSDPRMEDLGMPFDGKRMIFGSFESIVEKRA